MHRYHMCNDTTIIVDVGATLRFRRNPLNTPVYLLAQGNVLINGTIDLSATAPDGGAPGQGGPGGFDGGFGGYALAPAGDGKGPGGGVISSSAAFAQATDSVTGVNIRPDTNTYGNALLSPLVGGSGGAGANVGGGGGGGAILIAANALVTVNGPVLCNGSGGGYYAGGGSGGAIRIVAPTVN